LPRIRGLKPDFFKDELLCELPFEARLLFAGLWCYADKSGRLEDRPKYLKAEIFPYDKVDVEKLLNLLANPKLTDKPDKYFIRRYTIDGRQYIDIPTFLDHQKPHHTEKTSKIPEFNGYLTVTLLRKKDDTVHGSLLMDRDTVHGEGATSPSPVTQIVSILNSVLGTKYKPNAKETIELIRARLKKGFTVDDFRTVIEKKYAEWGQDEKMSAFLRPETLFGTKFEAYLNQVIARPMSKNEQTIDRVFKQMEELENDKRRSKDVGNENDIIIS